jgi:hypothetical protein
MNHILKLILLLSIILSSTNICLSKGTNAKVFEDFSALKLQLDKVEGGLSTLKNPLIPENFEYLLKSISIPGRKPEEFCYVIDLSEGQISRQITLHFQISNNGAPASEVRKFLETGKSNSDLKLMRISVNLHKF